MWEWKWIYFLVEITTYRRLFKVGGINSTLAPALCFIICSAEVVDFTKPSGSNSTHPKLFHWVKMYFENAEQSKLLPTTMNSRETTVQGSSHANNVVSCSSKCDTAVDGDDAIVIDTDGPVAKKCKLDNNKSETQFYFTNILYHGINLPSDSKFLWVNVVIMDLIHYSFVPLILFLVPYTLDLLP